MIDEIVTVKVTKAAMNNTPMYIAVRQVKKIAKKPPTAANEMRREITIAFTVAAAKNNINASTPVKAKSVTIPACIKCKYFKHYKWGLKFYP